MNSDNYIRFGKAEMIVQFGTDRGVWKSRPTPDNAADGYFFRAFADKLRFACVNPDLERRLIDLGYRAGDQVGISRQTRNRSVIWNVRIIEPETSEAPRPAPRPAPKRTPPPLPEAKYAPPPTAWPEVETPTNGHAPKPVARAQDNHAPVVAKPDSPLGRCLCEALEACKIAHQYAVEIGLPTIFAAEQIQKMGVSIFIERMRNGAVTDRSPQRVNGATESWRH